MTPSSTSSPLVVITGAGRRGQVAEAVSQHFAALGWHVALIARQMAEARDRASELGPHASAHACDLSDAPAVAAIADEIAAAHGTSAHAVVCAAGGFAADGGVDVTMPETWERMFRINVATAANTTRAFLGQLRATRGSLVYLASASALPEGRTKGMSAYVASKVGVLALMRSIAAEERHHGVRANALAPTAIRTDANVISLGDKVTYVERTTVARWCEWLVSAECGPVSGQAVQLG